MLNNNLRITREEIGMSVSELARRTNSSRTTITNIELHGQEPTGKLLIQIGEALKRDPRDIFFISFVSHEEQNVVPKIS